MLIKRVCLCACLSVRVFACLYVCGGGGGEGVALKALRNDMGCRYETLRGVSWRGVGVRWRLLALRTY